MGRFDALTAIDEQTPPPSKASSSPVATPTPSASPNTPLMARKPEIMKSGNHEKDPSPPLPSQKPEKYSTLIRADLLKQIKVRATEMDIKDYQLIEMALDDFFKHHK